MANKKLGEFLIEKGAITNHQLEEALEEQKKSGGLIGEILVKLGFIDEDLLIEVLTN